MQTSLKKSLLFVLLYFVIIVLVEYIMEGELSFVLIMKKLLSAAIAGIIYFIFNLLLTEKSK